MRNTGAWHMSGDPKHKWTMCPLVRYVRLSDRTGRGTDAPPTALVLIDGSSANKDVNVSMGKGHLGLSQKRDAAHVQRRSVCTSNSSFFEVNRQIIETRDFQFAIPHMAGRTLTSRGRCQEAAGQRFLFSGTCPIYRNRNVHS